MGFKHIHWLTRAPVESVSPLGSQQMFQTDLTPRIIPQQRPVGLLSLLSSIERGLLKFSGVVKRTLTTCSSDKGQPKETCKAKQGSRIKRASEPAPTVDHFDNDSQDFTILKTTSPFPSDDNWKESADGKGFALQQKVSPRSLSSFDTRYTAFGLSL